MPRGLTGAQLRQVVRNLERVKSVGQARLASGSALTWLSSVYRVNAAADIPDDLRNSQRRELDTARRRIEHGFNQLPKGADRWPVDSADWGRLKNSIIAAHVAAAGVFGSANHRSVTSLGSILGEAITNAPTVFVESAGKALQKVGREAGKVTGIAAKEVGKGAGNILIGLGSGLGLMLPVVLLGVAAWLALKFKGVKGLLKAVGA